MSATDELLRMLNELCRLLNERGVEWRSFFEDGPDAPICMGWVVGERAYRVYRIDGRDGTLCIDGLTPEQAIAATLGDTDATDARQGDGTCHDMGGCRWFRCSACGFGIEDMYVNDEDEYPPADQPRYCPNCGRLVVEVDA